MANVPNTTTFTFQDVTTAVYNDTAAGRNLSGAFSDALGWFDPSYVGSKNQLLNFRNFQAYLASALFAAGFNPSYTGVTTTDSFVFATDAIVTTTIASRGLWGVGCASTLTFLFLGYGVNSSGSMINTSDKYNFATRTVTAGATMTSNARYTSWGFGTNSISWTGGGNDNVVNYWNVCKYTHSSDTATAMTALTVTRPDGAIGAGNQTVGMIWGGYPGTYINEITFSNDSRYTGSVSGSDVCANGAAGNSTIAVRGNGMKNSDGSAWSGTERYTYSSRTNATGTTMSTTDKRYGSAAGNSTHGYFAGGNHVTQTSHNSKYNYSADTAATSTSLSQGRAWLNTGSPYCNGLQ